MPGTGIRYVKNVAVAGHVAGHIQQRDAFCASPDIPPHGVRPQLKRRAGGRIRALGVDHHLVVKTIFVQGGSRLQKRAPRFPVGGDLAHGLRGKLHIIFQFCHLIAPAFLSVSVLVFFFWENRFSPVIPNLSTGFAGFSTWMSTAYPHESRLCIIEEGGRSRIRPSAHLRFFLSLSSYSRHAASAALLCPHGFSIISRSNGLFVKYLTLPRCPPRFPPRRRHRPVPYSAAARLSSSPARRTPQRRPQSTPPAARAPSSPSNRLLSPLPA